MNGMKNQIILKKYLIFMIFLLSSILLPLCLGAAKIENNKQHAIARFIQPYIGEFTCQKLQWGENDLLKNYEKITLTLQPKGKGLLVMIPKKAKRSSQKVQYSYDYTTKQIHFKLDSIKGNELVTMPLQNGKFSIVQTILEKPLYIEFEL